MREAIEQIHHGNEPSAKSDQQDWKDLVMEQKTYYQKMANEYREKYL